jgi:hypothetical protein
MVCFKKLVEADVANEALKRQVEPPSQKNMIMHYMKKLNAAR